MKAKITIILLIVAIHLLHSCSGDDEGIDTEKPLIFLNHPGEHQAFFPGDEIYLNIDFSDNLELGSYKIDVQFSEEGHTHKGNEAFAEWSYTETEIFETGSVEYHLEKQIPIPVQIDNLPIAEGHYHLRIYLLDKAGNEQALFSEIAIGEDTH